MSRTHHFVSKRAPMGAKLPPNQFVRVTGKYLTHTRVPMGHTAPDRNHLYLRVQVLGADGHVTGTYEAAVNIRSSGGEDDPRVQYTEREEALDPAGPAPRSGVTTDDRLSFKDLGLHEADFAPVEDGDLLDLVTQFAQDCELVTLYGWSYDDGTGLHDLHMNSGEPDGSTYRNQDAGDGALAFHVQYQGDGATEWRTHWLFLKFSSQNLP